jgi:membrane protease YdiL (CAAX protease family)
MGRSPWLDLLFRKIISAEDSIEMRKILKSGWTVTWKYAVFVTAWAFLSAPFIILIYRGLPPGHPLSWKSRLFLEPIGATAIVIVLWIMIRFVDRRSWETSGLALQHVLADVLIGLGLGIGMMGLSLALLWITGSLQIQAPIISSGVVLLMAGSAMLLNSVTQEVLIRGYLFQTIRTQSNSTLAVILTALFFSLIHRGGGAFLPAINLFLAGLLLGIGYVRSGNLWLPIALHFAWNFLEGPALGLAVSGQVLDSGWRILELRGPVLWAGGAFGLEGGLAATLSTIAGVEALRWLTRRRVV